MHSGIGIPANGEKRIMLRLLLIVCAILLVGAPPGARGADHPYTDDYMRAEDLFWRSQKNHKKAASLTLKEQEADGQRRAKRENEAGQKFRKSVQDALEALRHVKEALKNAAVPDPLVLQPG